MNRKTDPAALPARGDSYARSRQRLYKLRPKVDGVPAVFSQAFTTQFAVVKRQPGEDPQPRFGPLARALDEFKRGDQLFVITDGYTQLLDILDWLILDVLRDASPPNLDIMTYAASIEGAKALSRWIADKRIGRLRLCVDHSGLTIRSAEYYQRIINSIGVDNIRFARTHAKIHTLSTECGWRILLHGSANSWSKSYRFEQLTVMDNADCHALFTDLLDEVFAASEPPHALADITDDHVKTQDETITERTARKTDARRTTTLVANKGRR